MTARHFPAPSVACYDSIVIGGGFFGASIAEYLKKKRRGRVLLVEQSDRIMSQASYANQARVHNGYHYPRSVLTGLRSRANYKRFIRDFAPAIFSDFKKLYAIARTPQAKITARQFEKFCALIEAPLKKADVPSRKLFSSDLIEEIYEVEEVVFNAVKLAEIMLERLAQSEVEVLSRTVSHRIEKSDSGLKVCLQTQAREESVLCDEAFLCTYSAINSVLERSSLPLIPFRHEMAEIALVEPPEGFGKLGITIMDGPFFSMMPFPSQRLHSLSHVRYTPHWSWSEFDNERLSPEYTEAKPGRSQFSSMLRDAQKLMPGLAGTDHVRSLYQSKTILPRNDHDDGRPILFKKDHGLKGLFCILGGKMDNIYDVFAEFDQSRTGMNYE